MKTTWSYPSSSSTSVYTVTRADNGMLGCDCKGWTIKRPNKPRRCKHMDDVILRHGLETEVRNGEYVFVLAKESVHTDSPLLTAAATNDTIIESGGGDDMANGMVSSVAREFEGMKASGMVAGKYGHLVDADGRIIGEKFDKAFSNGQWVMDEKLDGHRCQIMKRGGEVTFSLKSIPSLPDHLVAAIEALPVDCHLDGELCVPGGISTDVPNLALRNQLQFLVFDLVAVAGESCIHLSLKDRRMLLETLAQHFTGGLQLVAQTEPSWARVQAIWAKGGEGAILKQLNSPYRPGFRGSEWLKVKRLKSITVTVTGFRTGSFGPTAVVDFVLDNGVAGSCKNLNNIELARTAADPTSFIGKRLVIQCQQITRTGSPRHPMFDHWAGEAE